MRFRILAVGATVIIVAVAALLIPTVISIRSHALVEARLELQREAAAAASSLSPDEAPTVANLRLIDNGEEHAVSLYGRDGRLIDGDGPPGADAAVHTALRGSFGETRAGRDHAVSIPIPRPGGALIALRISENYADPVGEARRRVLSVAALAAGIVGVSVVLHGLLARRLTRQLDELSRAAVSIGEGQVGLSIPVTGVKELDDLGGSLTAMVERIDRQVQRERAFSGEVSHQLRTPVAAMRVAIEAEMALPRADRLTILHETLAAAEQLEQTVNDLLMLARGTPGDRAMVDLSEFIQVARRRWAAQFASQGRRIEATSAPAQTLVSSAALTHLIDVLCANALAHGSATTVIACGTIGTPFLSVGDRRHIVDDPFARSVRDGHGIGLKLARTLADAEGADLSWRSSPLVGNVFTVRFARSSAPPRPMSRIDGRSQQTP